MKNINIIHDGPCIFLSKYVCNTQQRIASVAFPYPTVIMIVNGRKIITSDYENISARASEWVLIPGGSFFGIENIPDIKEAYEALAVSFCVRPSVGLELSHEIVKCQAILPNNAMKTLMDMMLRSKDDLCKNAMSYLVQAFYCELKMAGVLPFLFLPNVKQYTANLMHIFSRRPDLSHTIDTTAIELNVGRATLLRKLQAEGVTYKEILSKTRMSHALSLLQAGCNSHVVAKECGYKSVQRFSENFKKFSGITPEQYRNMINSRL